MMIAAKERNMSKLKLIITVTASMMVMPVFAVQMCVKTNTYISVFRRDVNGTSGEYKNSDTDKIWKVVYDYKTITGFASCNSLASTTNPTTVVTTGATSGVNCWCKMAPVPTYTNGIPTGVVSYWVYLKNYDSADECADNSGCTASCMNAMKSDASFRDTVFSTIW